MAYISHKGIAYHKDADGITWELKDLKDSHLTNIIKRIERKAASGIKIMRGGGDCPDDFWYDEYYESGNDVLKRFGYHLYVSERDRRKDIIADRWGRKLLGLSEVNS